jgi:predicted small lipoprotein YifL
MKQAALGMGSLRSRMAIMTLAAAASALLAGCGQKGALYLPEASGEVITRPTQTPEPAATPASPSDTPAPTPPATQPSPSETKKTETAPATPPASP